MTASKLKLLRPGEAYVPNVKDVRVQRKLERVLTWANETLSETITTQVHHDELHEVFGTATHDLSKYLRQKLLIQVGTYTPGKASFKYRLNASGAEQLSSSMVNTSFTLLTDTERLRRKFAHEIETGQFEYHRSSDRDWHSLQTMWSTRRNGYTGPIKSEFWPSVGYRFDYDFVACAPSILSQLAANAGLLDVLQEGVLRYVDDRSVLREHVVALTGCEPKAAKQLINSLFNGARLSRNPRCAAYALLDYDYEAMTRLMEDRHVAKLRRGIRLLWKQIERASNTKLKGSAKWNLYFVCERMIMDSVIKFLGERDIKVFTEHDGFRTNKKVEVEDLLRRIRKETGLEMKIKEEVQEVRGIA